MKAFKNSDTLLVIGFVYSVIFASLVFAFAGYLMYNGFILCTSGGSDTMYPLIALFEVFAFFIGVVIYFGGGIICIALGTMAILSAVNGLKATNQHKRRNYKCCKIFSSISLNPFSIIGANIGLSIWRQIDEAQRFLNS